jgi:hypothetical protein
MALSTAAYASKDKYSTERWKTFGLSAGIVLAMEDSAPDDSSFYGLVLECNSRGAFRISVKDILASPGDFIEWESDKRMGTINNQASLVVRTKNESIEQNKLIIEAMKISTWIEFKNNNNGSSAKYTLNGFSKAMDSTKCAV